MTKQEFMKALRQELEASCTEETVNELLSDFEQHFDEAVREGKSEETVCEMLGSPAEIAAQCSEELTSTKHNEEPTAQVYVQISDANLHLVSGLSSDFHVQITSAGRPVDDRSFQIANNNGQLRIIQRPETNFFARIFRAFEIRKICVELPVDFSGSLDLNVSSGNTRLENLNVGSCMCKAKSGNVALIDVDAKTILARSKSGNVHLSHCTGDAHAECRSGNVTVKSHRGSVTGIGSSGNVKVETDCITRPAILESRSGSLSLELKRLDADLKLNCLSGNIRFKIGELNGNIDGKTTSGNIKGSLAENTVASFSLSDSRHRNAFQNAASVPDGVPMVTLSTKSGIVKVDKWQ